MQELAYVYIETEVCFSLCSDYKLLHVKFYKSKVAFLF